MKRLIISLVILLVSSMSASVYAEVVYTGTIGEYKVHMVLDENYEGYYYYDHRPQSRFALVKTQESECDECWHCVHITLQEYTPGTNKNTGEFIGKYRFCKDGGIAIVVIDGTFRNKITGKTLPFEASDYYTYEIY